MIYFIINKKYYSNIDILKINLKQILNFIF